MKSGRVILLLTAALGLYGCTGSNTGAPDSVPTSTAAATTVPDAAATTAPATTTTTSPVAAYEHVIPVGADGINYRQGGDDLESVGPQYLAAAEGTVYFADPVANTLWVIGADTTRTVDLASLDILNVTSMTVVADTIYVVEVVFAPARQRLHELTRNGDLVATMDLAAGARLEDGLSGVLVDDSSRPTIALAGGARYADPTSGMARESILLGGHTVMQVGTDMEIDGDPITADLAAELGGLRLLGAGGEYVVLIREEVISTTPIEVLMSVEWYGPDGFAGSALVPLDQQEIPGPPGLSVTEDGRVVMMIARADAVQISELILGPNRIVAGANGT